MRWSTLEHNKCIFKEWPLDNIIFHAFLFVKSTEPTNIFKSGVKETVQCAPTIHCSYTLKHNIILYYILDKLRERRNLALQKFKKLGVANLVLSLLTIGVGVGILVVSGRGSAGWPVFNFGPLVVGIIVSIS